MEKVLENYFTELEQCDNWKASISNDNIEMSCLVRGDIPYSFNIETDIDDVEDVLKSILEHCEKMDSKECIKTVLYSKKFQGKDMIKLVGDELYDKITLLKRYTSSKLNEYKLFG